MIRPLLRSVLYVPGSNQRALDKAATMPVDALILDLEDPVHPDRKDEARDNIARQCRNLSETGPVLAIRINGLDTAWAADDIAMAAASGARAVVIPKVMGIDELKDVRDRLNALGAPACALWAMVETASCLLALPEFARANRESQLGLAALVFGANDLALETGTSADDDRRYLMPWIMQMIAAGRAGGMSVLDAVYNNYADTEGFVVECGQARACGFDGKTLIHPSQIAAANESFSPTPKEVEHAAAIVKAFSMPENAGAAVITIEGRMVELLHLQQAEGLMQRHSEILNKRGQIDKSQ